MLPWWILLPGAIVHVFRPVSRTTWRQGGFLLIWMTVWFTFFSFLHFRKEEYILPMFPAVMLLIGKMFSDCADRTVGGHIGWRTFADATKVGLAWMFGRPTTVVDPADRAGGDLRMTIAIRAASVFLAVAAGLLGIAGLLIISPRVREFLYTYPCASSPWIGENEHDRTAIDAAATFMSAHLAGSVAFLVALIVAMVLAAVLIFKQRPLSAMTLWACTMAAVMLAVVHVYMDRVVEPFRSQQAFAQRLQQVAREAGPDTKMILFGAEEHELVFLLPDRFDAIPRMRFKLLAARLAALKNYPVLVLLPRKDYENPTLFGRRAWGELADMLKEVPTEMPQYDRAHNDAMVILRAMPRPKGS